MTVVIENPDTERSFIRVRQERGLDRKDDVGDGVYVVSPDSINEDQSFVALFSWCFMDSIEDAGLGLVSAGGNGTDQEVAWTHNYRCPDIMVVLGGNTVQDRGTHWLGGPDFAVEILSKGDRSRQKFDFYATVGTRELLLIDRQPWALELHRLEVGELRRVGKSTIEASDVLTGAVLALSFRLVASEPRPTIEIGHADGGQHWSV